MEFNSGKKTMSGGSHEDDGSQAGEGGGGIRIDFLRLEISLVDIEKSFALIFLRTRKTDLDTALDFAYHARLSRADHEHIGRLVTVLRCGLDGRLYPPGYNIHRHYADYISANYPGPSAGTTPGR